MKQLPCTLLAGIIGLAAIESAHRYDLWLSFSLAAAAMLVLLAPALFDVPVEADNADDHAEGLFSLMEPRR